MTSARLHLLDTHELAETAPPEAIRLPIELVDPSPENPRQALPEVNVLAASIREFGLMQPVFVRRAGERYQVLSGHRRRAAFLWLHDQEPDRLDWRGIPAVVRTVDDDDVALRMLISSQIDIRKWKPREEASILERLYLKYGSFKRVGEALNRTESYANKRLRVYSDAVLSAYVQTGKLKASIAEELLPIKDADTRREYAERAVVEEWSQEQAKKHSRALRKDSSPRRLAELAREMADLLPSMDPRYIPIEVGRDLWVVHGAIEQKARGGTTVMPTIEQAERVAHVTPAAKARADRQRQDRQRQKRARAKKTAQKQRT